MEVYLFPVGHVLLYPSFSKPFFVVEPQFIAMVEDSVREGIPIAVGTVLEPFTRHEYKVGDRVDFVSEVVGYGHPLIVERRSDGSLVVFIEGKGKARLGRVLDRKKQFIVCDAEKIEENHEIKPNNYYQFMTVHKVMVNWMHIHIPDENSRHQFLSYVKTPEQVVGCYASYLIADQDIQQMLLENNDINEKLSLLNRIISSKGLVA